MSKQEKKDAKNWEKQFDAVKQGNTESKPQKYQEAVDSMKKAGKQTYTITCESGHECVLVSPSMRQSASILPLMIDGKMAEAALKLVNDCWVAGDDEIRNTEDLRIEVGISALEIIDLKVAKVKKN